MVGSAVPIIEASKAIAPLLIGFAPPLPNFSDDYSKKYYFYGDWMNTLWNIL